MSFFRGACKKGSHSAALLQFWSGRRVSNSRPQPWQGCALPTELLPRGAFFGGEDRSRTDLDGFAGRCITALLPRQRKLFTKSQRVTRCDPKFWSGRRVSNSRPQPWQGCALPTELLPHWSVTTDFTTTAGTAKTWSGRRVSNSRPQPWQGCALPTELLPHWSPTS